MPWIASSGLFPFAETNSPRTSCLSTPPRSVSRPHLDGCRHGGTSGSDECPAHSCASRILCFMDGRGCRSPARRRLQLYTARFRSPGARRLVGCQAARVPFLLHGVGLQPPAYSQELPLYAGVESDCAAIGRRSHPICEISCRLACAPPVLSALGRPPPRCQEPRVPNPGLCIPSR